MVGIREEIKSMAQGFRWGRRSLVPRSAEDHALEPPDDTFPTDWARTELGTTARQLILKSAIGPMLRNEVSLKVHGLDHLRDAHAPVIFYSNHTSHLDATIILTTLPDRWQSKVAVGAARDYFFDVWWRKTFTALVYGGFPIDRARGGRGSVSKARELLDDGWSLVVFPEGTRSPDGHVQRFRHGAARLSLEADVGVVPIAILGAFQAWPKGANWPRSGRPQVSVRYGRALYPEDGETHQALSQRMTQAVTQLMDEDRSTWWEALQRAERGETPSMQGPSGPEWRRRWDGLRPMPRRRTSTWE